MKIESIDINVNKVVNIAIDAGKEILRIYQQDSFNQQSKLDKSPLTEADIAAHNLITRQLKQITDRKSTRLNSSHLGISYAVFCLKKKFF